ncbi:MAG TPA: alpha/beta hydrolase [Cytophagaceae bacterium]|jgi:pimeloyl-ACP methyl ester carboxylesterase|nr:alpha/beta hydrolase [Cytophagaceae bacterium]
MLEYTDSGYGFPLVLIHGFCESKELWKYCEKELSIHFRVIAPDLPGFGESRLEQEEVSMEYFAEEIRMLLDSLKIEKCVMVGHSLGGYVALAFAEQYGNYLTGLGLFHSTAFADSAEKKESRNKTILFIQKYGVAMFAESFVPPLFSLRNRERVNQEIKELIQTASVTSASAVIETTKAMRDRRDRSEVLRKVNIPVLFVVGKLDGSVSLEKSLEQCHLPKHSIVHFLEGVGHMGMIENKLESSKILINFATFSIS